MSLEATVSFRGPTSQDKALLARLPGALRSLVEHHNGCIWLDGALHLRGACDAPAWHSLNQAWDAEHGVLALSPKLQATDIPFAQTTFGDELILREHDVLRLRGSTGMPAEPRALESLGTSLGGFLAELERDAVRYLDLDPARREPRAEWEDLLAFWFEDCGVCPERIPEVTMRCFNADEGFHTALRDQFLPLLERGEAGGLEKWCETPRGTVAAVIVLDQLSRNLRRGTPEAFALDASARGIAKRAIAAGVDRRLRAIEAVFLYLPFEHSESLDDQVACVAFYTELCHRCPEVARDSFTGYIGRSQRRRVLIERFGRFPQRNQTLGRPSTPEEIDLLALGGDRL